MAKGLRNTGPRLLSPHPSPQPNPIPTCTRVELPSWNLSNPSQAIPSWEAIPDCLSPQNILSPQESQMTMVSTT